MKLIGGNVTTIDWTDTSTGTDADPYDITFTHDDVTRTNTTTTETPGYGATFTAISGISTSAEGHVTAVTTKTVTIPASDNTDTNTFRPIHNTPIDGATTTSISSDWAFDNVKTAVPTTAVFTDTNTVTGVKASGASYTTGNIWFAGGRGTTPVFFSTLRKMFIDVDPDQRGIIDYIGWNASNYIEFYNANTTKMYFGSAVEFEFQSTGDFHADGNITAYSATTASDAKLKTNIKTVENALDKVCALDGVTFDWIKDGKESAGVIAQTTEKVFPRAVSEVKELNGDDTRKVVDYNQLSALFIEAIKELKAENAELRAMIEEGKK